MTHRDTSASRCGTGRWFHPVPRRLRLYAQGGHLRLLRHEYQRPEHAGVPLQGEARPQPPLPTNPSAAPCQARSLRRRAPPLPHSPQPPHARWTRLPPSRPSRPFRTCSSSGRVSLHLCLPAQHTLHLPLPSLLRLSPAPDRTPYPRRTSSWTWRTSTPSTRPSSPSFSLTRQRASPLPTVPIGPIVPSVHTSPLVFCSELRLKRARSP